MWFECREPGMRPEIITVACRVCGAVKLNRALPLVVKPSTGSTLTVTELLDGTVTGDSIGNGGRCSSS